MAAAVGISRQGVLHYFPSKTHLLLGVLELRDEETIARAEERAGRRTSSTALLGARRAQPARADLTRLFTVLSAESVAPEHLGHEHFRERYRHGPRRAGRGRARGAGGRRARSPTSTPAIVAILLAAVMDGLQLQFLLEPEAVDMVEPLAALMELLV